MEINGHYWVLVAPNGPTPECFTNTLLLVLIPLLAALYFMYLKKNRYANLRMSGLQAFAGHSWRGWLRIYVPPILRISALALLIIALSRPQDVNKKKEIKGSERNI